MLDEFVTPEQLVAVPVGPGRVAKPVQMVLSGAPVIRTLGESGIPDVAVRAYKKAEARLAVSDPGCGVPWTLLAAIGRVESNHGRFGGAQLRDDGSATRRIRGIPLDGRPNVALIRDSDGGALDGDTVYDRAVGPMQFIPSTWRAVNADGNGDGFADPNNMFDAAQGAAQYLCTGTSNLRDPARAAQAVRRYNNADSYVRVVLALAQTYQAGRVIGLPSTGELLPDEPDDPPAVRPWPTDAPPGDTVLAKPAPTQRTEPAAPPRAVTRPRTTAPPPNRPTRSSPGPASPSPPNPPATTTAPTITPKPSEPVPPQPSKPKPIAAQGDRADAVRAEASEPKPTQPSKPTPTQADALQADAVRAEAVRADAVRAATVRADAVRAEGVRAPTIRAPTVRAEDVRAEDDRAERRPSPSRLNRPSRRRPSRRPRPSRRSRVHPRRHRPPNRPRSGSRPQPRSAGLRRCAK